MRVRIWATHDCSSVLKYLQKIRVNYTLSECCFLDQKRKIIFRGGNSGVWPDVPAPKRTSCPVLHKSAPKCQLLCAHRRGSFSAESCLTRDESTWPGSARKQHRSEIKGYQHPLKEDSQLLKTNHKGERIVFNLFLHQNESCCWNFTWFGPLFHQGWKVIWENKSSLVIWIHLPRTSAKA